MKKIETSVANTYIIPKIINNNFCSKKGLNQMPLIHFIFILLQGAQAVGMGQEAHKVPAAAELYNKANEILG